MQFWDNVKALLKARGQSLRSLSQVIGVSPTALSNYGRGAIPSLDVAVRIADVLEVSLDSLVYGGQSRTACPSPAEHKILRELTNELGLQEVMLLARLSSLAVALSVVERLEHEYPQAVERADLLESVDAPSSDVLEASLLWLQRRRLVTVTEADAKVWYALAVPKGAVHLNEPNEIMLNIKRAAKLLFSRVLPAQEARDGSGHLLTMLGRVPEERAAEMAEELLAVVRSRCKQYITEEGNTEVALVFAVARNAHGCDILAG